MRDQPKREVATLVEWLMHAGQHCLSVCLFRRVLSRVSLPAWSSKLFRWLL
jgi:hypothetical protein